MSLRRSASVALQRLPQGLQFVPVAPAKLLPCQGGLQHPLIYPRSTGQPNAGQGVVVTESQRFEPL